MSSPLGQIRPTRPGPAVVALAAFVSQALFLAASSPAIAGAWPRGEGKAFLSVSHQSRLDGPDTGAYASLFYEHGLSDSLTLGVDAGRGASTGDTSAIVFLRHSMFAPDGPDVVAVELGIGMNSSGSSQNVTIRPGLSWGRPYQAWWGDGWISADASYSLGRQETGLAKLDVTLGVNHSPRSSTSIQLQFAKATTSDATFAIAPSHVHRIADNLFLELGGTHEFRRAVTQMKVGFWYSF